MLLAVGWELAATGRGEFDVFAIVHYTQVVLSWL